MDGMWTQTKRSLTQAAVIAIVLFALVACSRRARWTPQSVAPPASLQNALANAKRAVQEERALLPADQPATVPLSRDGAILTALARNRSLAVQKFDPRIAVTRIAEARAAFDPNLTATASYGRDRSPVRTVTVDEFGVETELLTASASRSSQGNVSLSEFLPTGTEVFLSGGFSRRRSFPADSEPGEPSYSGNWSAEVNQALLRGFGPAVNLISLRQARNSEAVSHHVLRGFVIDLVRQVEEAYWNLVLANETLKIRQFAVRLAQEQLSLNEELIRVGKLARGAQFSAESELAARRTDLIDARATVNTRRIDLIRLLNPEADAQWALTFVPTDLAETATVQMEPGISAKLADAYRPELAQSRLDLANQDLAVIQTRNGLLPRLDGFASYGRISDGNSFSAAKEYLDDDNFDNYRVGLEFQMAPWNRAERARYRRANFQQQQAEAALYNLGQVIEAEVRIAALEARRQAERIPATREALKSREEELRVEKDRFRVGASTNLDVLLVQNGLIGAQLSEITARIGFIQALTRLYDAEGTLLDRRGVGTESPEESAK